MRLSIVIPVLNEEATLERAVERAWATGAAEVIVVDGGSRDDTVSLARRLNCRLLESAPGRAWQMNAGAARATGDVLLFLHADNWLPDGAAAQIAHAMESADLVGGAFRQAIGARGRIYRWIECGNACRVRLWGAAYGDQGIFVRRSVFEQHGGYPEVPLLEDLYFARALRRRGHLALLPGPLHVSARRWQQYGVVRQTLRNWLILAAAALGVSPARLARWYRPHGGAR